MIHGNTKRRLNGNFKVFHLNRESIYGSLKRLLKSCFLVMSKCYREVALFQYKKVIKISLVLQIPMLDTEAIDEGGKV